MPETSTLRLTAAVTREGRLYVAQCLELDVASQGATFDEALANLREALELRLEGAPASLAPAEPALIAPFEVRRPSRGSGRARPRRVRR